MGDFGRIMQTIHKTTLRSPSGTLVHADTGSRLRIAGKRTENLIRIAKIISRINLLEILSVRDLRPAVFRFDERP